MNSVFGLALAILLITGCRAEATPRFAVKQDAKSVVRPDWAKDMPPESSAEYTVELRRRMLEGTMVRVRAIVQVFHATALSSINKGGLGGIHVAGTKVKVASPQKYDGLELLIHHAKSPGDDSCWRVTGCVAEFDIVERQLEARQAGMRGMGFIYDRDLKNVSLVQPNPSTGRTADSNDRGTK